jgi:hypothetical protein
MSLAYNIGDRSASSAPRHHHQNPKHRRRYSADAWHCLRDQIDREHRTLAAFDPRSPRVRPTVASFTLVEEGV